MLRDKIEVSGVMSHACIKRGYLGGRQNPKSDKHAVQSTDRGSMLNRGHLIVVIMHLQISIYNACSSSHEPINNPYG